MRIDKYLADCGYGTRREVKELMKSGIVSVEGNTIKDPGQHIEPEKTKVTVRGETVVYRRLRYYLLNKPAGVITATEDASEKTVLELLPEKERKGIFPVGRLDKDTTGLLLLTNDGELAHMLLSPKRHVEKTYEVETEQPIPKEAVEMFRKGLVVDEGFRALPAGLAVTGDKSANVTITEGKYHQVKRMFAAIGCHVIKLKRLTMGTLKLDEKLKEGDWRELSQAEITSLYTNQ